MIINDRWENALKIIEDKIDIVLTSPPYNTSRNSKYDKTNKGKCSYVVRYDSYFDVLSDDDYINWQIEMFNKLDEVLNKDGVILYNISYSSEKPSLLHLLIADIIRNTNFMVADVITWKKKNALPNNVSPNKLTRITEPVYVFCRKNELKSFQMNKEITSVRSTGQKMYKPIYNFVEASNNDGSCDLNKATYSSDLCEQLLRMYARDSDVIFDPYLGTGTTGVACERLGLKWYGSEISEAQCSYAENRILNQVKNNEKK